MDFSNVNFDQLELPQQEVHLIFNLYASPNYGAAGSKEIVRVNNGAILKNGKSGKLFITCKAQYQLVIDDGAPVIKYLDKNLLGEFEIDGFDIGGNLPATSSGDSYEPENFINEETGIPLYGSMIVTGTIVTFEQEGKANLVRPNIGKAAGKTFLKCSLKISEITLRKRAFNMGVASITEVLGETSKKEDVTVTSTNKIKNFIKAARANETKEALTSIRGYTLPIPVAEPEEQIA